MDKENVKEKNVELVPSSTDEELLGEIYKQQIKELVRGINNQDMLIAIYKFIDTIKDIKSVEVIYFLGNMAKSFKKKWGI